MSDLTTRFRALPRWFAPWRMRKIWRRSVVLGRGYEYWYLWPDGLFRKEKPQSWLGPHIDGNFSCWRILNAKDHMPPGMSYTRFTDTSGTQGRIAGRGVQGPLWLR